MKKTLVITHSFSLLFCLVLLANLNGYLGKGTSSIFIMALLATLIIELFYIVKNGRK